MTTTLDLENPTRFKTDPATLAVDRFMTRFIKIGGISLIAAVFAIFIFIFWQILPLFERAKVHPLQTVPMPEGRYQAIGVDEWSELPFVMSEAGRLTFVPAQDPSRAEMPELPMDPSQTVASFRYKPAKQGVIYGSRDGHFSWLSVNYEADFETGKRVV